LRHGSLPERERAVASLHVPAEAEWRLSFDPVRIALDQIWEVGFLASLVQQILLIISILQLMNFLKRSRIFEGYLALARFFLHL
jgi:hypothetical protein